MPNYDIFLTAPIDNGSTIGFTYQVWQGGIAIASSFSLWAPTAGQTEIDLEATAIATAQSYATGAGYTPYNTIQKWYLPSSTTRTTSAFTPALVGTGATGTQVSATKDATVRASVSTSTTVNISSGAGATSAVTLKICATNSATEASWTPVATFESDQTISLALALGSVQIIKGQLCADVPAGWYYKLVNTGSGTHSEAAISGQETIYG